MDEDLNVGLCVIKVLCLIVIAMSVHKIAHPRYSFMKSHIGGKEIASGGAGLRYQVEQENAHVKSTSAPQSGFIGDGQYQAPNFWNIGDIRSQKDNSSKLLSTGAESSSSFKDGKSYMKSGNRFSEDALQGIVNA